MIAARLAAALTVGDWHIMSSATLTLSLWTAARLWFNYYAACSTAPAAAAASSCSPSSTPTADRDAARTGSGPKWG